MKILWITNTLFSYIYKDLGVAGPPTGGWMQSSADAIINLHSDIEIAVAAPFGSSKMIKGKINGIMYFALPCHCEPFKSEKKLSKVWHEILECFNPDIVHIHGTEFTHSYSFVKEYKDKNIVVSIQGLVGVYGRYSQAGILFPDYVKSITLKELFTHEFLNSVSFMQRRGNMEKEIIRNVKYVIGRTEWDKIHTLATNPKLKYFFNNETLRNAFYNRKWSLDNCIKHSIFLSQTGKPLKGLHMVLKALPLIIEKYPDTKVFISGNDYLKNNGLFNKFKRSCFAKYINNIVTENKLEKHIIFLGLLNEEEMADRYQKSHVFVCPSSIENSPNSLGEAQIIGTPLIASYVGGIPDMVKQDETGLLYRFEEYEILAYRIMKVFSDDAFAINLSENERIVARHRHNKIINANELYNIYKNILAL